jgi:hypothetical protein
MSRNEWPELRQALESLPVQELGRNKATQDAQSVLVGSIGKQVSYSFTELAEDENGNPQGVRTIKGAATLEGVNRLG